MNEVRSAPTQTFRYCVMRPGDTAMNIIDLKVEGMSCGLCTKHVTQALQTVAGVDLVEVNLSAGRVRVQGIFHLGVRPCFSR
jgi:hypothetical protein